MIDRIGYFIQKSKTFFGSTEPPDIVYEPAFPVDLRYQNYFKATMLTDHEGNCLKCCMGIYQKNEFV